MGYNTSGWYGSPGVGRGAGRGKGKGAPGPGGAPGAAKGKGGGTKFIAATPLYFAGGFQFSSR